MSDIHSCGYWCSRPECIKAQRDDLRDKIIGPATELARAYNATADDFDGSEADCEQAKEDAEHAVMLQSASEGQQGRQKPQYDSF